MRRMSAGRTANVLVCVLRVSYLPAALDTINEVSCQAIDVRSIIHALDAGPLTVGADLGCSAGISQDSHHIIGKAALIAWFAYVCIDAIHEEIEKVADPARNHR